MNEAHNTYVNNLIGDIKKDSKPFWKYINKQKADKQGIPPLLTKDNKSAEIDKDKAETLNQQFTSVFTRSEYDSIPYQQPTTESMSKIIVTKERVDKILKGLNITKAMGPDNIHPRVLIELASKLSEVIAKFFKQSIDTEFILSEWKKATV